MKQKLIICGWIIACALFLACCNRNTENIPAMKMPVETRDDPGKRSGAVLTDTIAGALPWKKISKSISP